MRQERTTPTALIAVAILATLLASCSSSGSDAGVAAGTVVSAGAPPTAAGPQASTGSSEPDTIATEPATTTTAATPTTTLAPSTTVTTVLAGPPVFDPQTFGDNLTLSSFVLTVTVDNTNFGQLNHVVTTSGYIRDPFSAYELNTYSYDGGSDGDRAFFVNGRSYEETNSGDWYLSEAGAPGTPAATRTLDLRSGTVGGLLSADYAGPGEYAGIAAEHFVFDETDLASYSGYSADNPAPSVEGDYYVAQDGGYLLYTHSKESSPDRVYEVTEALSFVGQLTEISLPDDLAGMNQALDVGVGLAALLPPGTTLSSLVRYRNGIGVDYYTYRSPVRDHDELLAYFRALPPTNGWSVTHIGHIRLHLEPINCELKVDCVIMQNGSEQIVISSNGTITIEYDHDHVFGPA